MITSIDDMIIQPLIHAMTNMHTHKIYNIHIYVCIELDIEIFGSALLKVKQKKQIPLCLWAQFVRIGLEGARSHAMTLYFSYSFAPGSQKMDPTPPIVSA